MALRGKKPEIAEKRLKALFYGVAGSGKTTAAINFPRPYLIDTERGSENEQYVNIIHKNGGAVFYTTDFSEMLADITSLLCDKHPYKTLIIDPLTVVYDDLLEKSEEKVGSDFGRHYGEANKKMKHLLKLLTRLDMNVIITSHSKNEYSNIRNSKGKSEMVVTGQTFDCYKKLDYLFDLVFEVQRRGMDRVGVIKKTRIQGFPEGENFPFSYDTIAEKYGRKILERDVMPEILATEEQVKEVKRLIDLMNICPEVYQKWLDKASSETWEEMNADFMQKCIDALNKKMTQQDGE